MSNHADSVNVGHPSEGADVPRHPIFRSDARCPRCTSLQIRLAWAAMNTADFDSWLCTDCGNVWVR